MASPSTSGRGLQKRWRTLQPVVGASASGTLGPSALLVGVGERLLLEAPGGGRHGLVLPAVVLGGTVAFDRREHRHLGQGEVRASVRAVRGDGQSVVGLEL